MQFSPEFKQFRDQKFSMPPGDAPWNPHGFKNDYRSPTISEMSAHMPMLAYLGSQVEKVTEFGSRGANSTVAFLSSGCKRVDSWDIQPTPETVKLLEMKAAGKLPCEWNFLCRNTINPNDKIEPTDILMIDTLHSAAQVYNELKIHADNCKRFLIFHDVFSQSLLSLDMYGELGIKFAIDDFIAKNVGVWKKVYEVMFNHGLLVLEKVI